MPIAAIIALLAASTAAAAVKPRPWQWTPAQASAQLLAWQPAAFPAESGLTHGSITNARCAGRGAATRGRYTTFRCATVYLRRHVTATPEPGVLWVKVRRQGAGQPCVSRDSLAAVAAQCLNPAGSRVKGTPGDAWTAVRLELQKQLGISFPYQGPGGCVGFGAGYYECWFGDYFGSPANGKATVTMLSTGPRVNVIAMPTP